MGTSKDLHAAEQLEPNLAAHNESLWGFKRPRLS